MFICKDRKHYRTYKSIQLLFAIESLIETSCQMSACFFLNYIYNKAGGHVSLVSIAHKYLVYFWSLNICNLLTGVELHITLKKCILNTWSFNHGTINYLKFKKKIKSYRPLSENNHRNRIISWCANDYFVHDLHIEFSCINLILTVLLVVLVRDTTVDLSLDSILQ